MVDLAHHKDAETVPISPINLVGLKGARAIDNFIALTRREY
jgi:hypothetical protein